MIDFVFDWDRSKGWKYSDGASFGRTTKGQFLTADFWMRFAGKTVGIEKAHLQPQRDQSSAQLYTQNELSHLAEVSAATRILYLPERLTKRALNTYGMDDEKDGPMECVALLRFYNERPQITLQLFPAKEHTGRKAGLREIVKSSNKICNMLRVSEYRHHLVERARDMLSFCYSSLSTDARREFQIERKCSGKIEFNHSRVMSVFAQVRDENGLLRLNPNGKFIGIDTCRRALSQNHYKGKVAGTASSNISHHWHRSALNGINSWDERGIARRELRPPLKELMRVFRDAPSDRPIPSQVGFDGF